MPNKPALPLVLRSGDQPRLGRLVRSSTVSAGAAQRARIVLLAAAGTANWEIAELVGVSRPTVNLWRNRYVEQGMAGLADAPRPGRANTSTRPRSSPLRCPPPAGLGVTHWSSRLLADRVGLDHSTIAKAWKSYEVKPWKAETHLFSTDPKLEGKITDVVGL